MLGFRRKIHSRTAQTLLALMGSLWLLAAATPCVMAMTHCPPDTAAVADCDALTSVSCVVSASERLAPTAAVIDFSVVPVRLHALPALAVLHNAHSPDRYATVILAPPLNLRHAVLLI